ncbi:hypothetical protein FEDK69T_31120 [Flavobacterium enshiense DK69]|uniref:Uncharacterized protein n=1 Tax=Flavobacterium enshiense DK69 TaxID=1107311 RepID=V6S636_9FLAO|nr:hypothetical protein [Flavobacterium enshiense]ESU19855.1 hypothetical protein FEDK69T_31120 [Flavobacterium enshiense DK69]KGO92293.1 hypothetical protein Q767_15645 [Flavobacterium enshiense DK69]
MKKIIITFSLIFFSIFGFSQKITNENFENKFSQLLENLGKENWKDSEKLCSDLLEFTEPIPELDTEKKVLRYMFIYSTAGLLNEKKLSKEEALKRTIHLKDKQMIMPAHPFKSNCFVNCTQITDEDKNTFFSGVNNSKGTQIFSFEYVNIKNGIKETKDQLEGKFIVLKGTLNEISVDGNILPRFKLKFIEGEYDFVEN